jgi:hypothetical protein
VGLDGRTVGEVAGVRVRAIGRVNYERLSQFIEFSTSSAYIIFSPRSIPDALSVHNTVYDFEKPGKLKIFNAHIQRATQSSNLLLVFSHCLPRKLVNVFFSHQTKNRCKLYDPC